MPLQLISLFISANVSFCVLQLVAEAAAGPSQDEEAHQASAQELQSVKDSLSQAETRTKELEGQLENTNKVEHHKCHKLKNKHIRPVLILFKAFLMFRLRNCCVSPPALQVVTERETELRNVQEQSSRLQTELNRLRQELQEKMTQEETLRQQMAEKDEKTRKALLVARQKISHVTGERILSYCNMLHPTKT